MVFAPTGELLIAFAESSAAIGVFHYDPQSHELTMQRWLGRKPGQRYEGIAVSGSRVFASDYNTNRVRVFNFADGASLPDIDHLSLRRPCGLDVIDDRLLAVADRGNDRVVLLDLETFEVVRQLPSEGAELGKGQLRSPNDVTVDSGGNLLVMDTGNERIAVFREDGTFATTVMKGDFVDHGNTFCYMACNLQTGAIAVSNNDEHSISIFAPLFSD
jgi:6-phosphogluconolactonase (cycloisomerase 2 family)